jgi:tetratricopeptide (TPR) repeat protein
VKISLAIGPLFNYSAFIVYDLQDKHPYFVVVFRITTQNKSGRILVRRNCMENKIYRAILAVIVPTLFIGVPESISSQNPPCTKSDTICMEFEQLAEAGQFDAIIKKIDAAVQYSENARRYISKAYLALAGKDENTSEQEEAYCRKALEYGFNQAYMGLYFIHAQKDQEKALGFLRQYIETKPYDPVPYVILGEAELGKKNYQLADLYLRESKKVARARSARVEWMLFQTSFLLGNYQYAVEILESVVANSEFNEELRSLGADERFQGIEKRPEFRKFFTATNAHE